MKNIFALIFVLMLAGCTEKDKPVPSDNEMVYSIAVDISFLNNQGQDLLNSNTPDYYNYKNFELYYLVKDEIVSVADYDSLLINGMMLVTESNPYYLRCFTYANENDGVISESDGVITGISYTYLKLNDTETDTIKTEWESIKNKSFVNTKVWYNGVLYIPDGKPIDIIK